MEQTDTYKLSGETGWSISQDINNGWFVGYIEARNQVYFFATNIEPKASFDMNLFPMIRSGITFEALEAMKIIEAH